ncbi:hypothetical protein M408DRAFT_265479 [Serendipita vermifera MAFF 305830]|uniref:Cytochrome P450 n=1 Tax=Serendipita vermifera MAFF 305830 TaxID=933852 RepID=A0A0C3AT28_SERVB|nr:hypothetical protein M408DRAFT_265479 [Serendipita vermifera MAFF 305830]
MSVVIHKLSFYIPSFSYGTIMGALVLTPIVLPLLRTVEYMLRAYFSPARIVPGPSGGNLFFGHLGFIRDSPKGEWHEEVLKEHGHVLRYKAILGTDRLLTTDPKALNHVLANSMIYQRPGPIRYALDQLVGEGLLVAEGHTHKRQRRVMNPSFSSAHIKEMTEIFLEKAQELREVLLTQTLTSETSPSVRVDMLAYLTQATLDIIGLAGFNYSFNVLSNEQSELSKAFNAVLHPPRDFPVIQILKLQIPIFRYLLIFDQGSRDTREARRKMYTIGRELVQRKKAEVLEAKAAGDDAMRKSKDLLSLLIRSNMSQSGGGLSDDEVLHQIPTFLLAGHETTSTSTTWTLFSLATHPDVQRRLRSELLLVPTDTPTMGELDSLVYLDAVVRESLRHHSVVDGTIKVATTDDVVPLEKPFVGTDGKTRNAIKVSKGDSFFVPILMMNVIEPIWGPDGREFNPDRWLGEGPPKASQSLPSVWGGQMTFSAGPRSCIGFKFALIEMKALLFTLIRGFQFELAVAPEEVIRRSAAVTRPVIKSEIDKGGQMPMIIRPFSHT